MSDLLTPEQRSKNMQHIKAKNTSIEKKMRTALWQSGIRYRKNLKNLPGKPDIAITKYKIAVFCDSSFWHGKDYDTKKSVQTNYEYWNKKIRRNIERDKEVKCLLENKGWIVLHFWDDEINKKTEECMRAIKEAINIRIMGEE